MTIRLGTSTYPFLWDESATESIVRLRALGLRDFDIMLAPSHFWPADLTQAERKKLRVRNDANDINIESINLLGLDQNLMSPFQEVRAATVAQYHQLIDFAHDVGAKLIVVVPGKAAVLNPTPRDRCVAWLRQGLDDLLPHADDAGVALALENLPNSYLRTSADLLGVLRGYNSPHLKLCFDVANAEHVGEDLYAAIAASAPFLAQVHLSDASKARWAHDQVGTGTVDFSRAAKAMTDVNFAGAAIIEVIGRPGDAVILEARNRLLAISPTFSAAA
jgi:L-ribulose-5-phosphate 3-epimerase